ncbi:hypothetical protein RHSIM_RhsimUnG0089500 [Rhododendron simsii]|uniref:Uncharacterized protein n=1 Tax=Rhododendron simsii TaxID=118357 RepID=A0A834L565_RHOSS|nr:hypothetical protein RHSIM_RhsimUnG0089500 [Rhododendron simsii]
MALEDGDKDGDDESLLKRCFVLRDRVVVGGQRGGGGSEEEQSELDADPSNSPSLFLSAFTYLLSLSKLHLLTWIDDVRRHSKTTGKDPPVETTLRSTVIGDRKDGREGRWWWEVEV